MLTNTVLDSCHPCQSWLDSLIVNLFSSSHVDERSCTTEATTCTRLNLSQLLSLSNSGAPLVSLDARTLDRFTRPLYSIRIIFGTSRRRVSEVVWHTQSASLSLNPFRSPWLCDQLWFRKSTAHILRSYLGIRFTNIICPLLRSSTVLCLARHKCRRRAA